MDNATIQLFEQLTDSGELVFSRDLEPITAYDGYWYAWDEAHEQATAAYEAWCKDRTRQAYTVYLAAQERADAAENALARHHRGPDGPPRSCLRGQQRQFHADHGASARSGRELETAAMMAIVTVWTITASL